MTPTSFPNDAMKSKEPVLGTLLARQWCYVMPSSLVLYGFLHIIFRPQNLSMNVTCSINEPYSPWIEKVGISLLTCYTIAIIYYLLSSFFMKSLSLMEMDHLLGIYMAAVTTNLIAGIATAIYLSGLHNDICRDALGVESPYSQWAEWQVAAPLLAYVSAAIENKPCLTLEDYISIISMALCIFFGYLMHLNQSEKSGLALFILSTVVMIIPYYFALKIYLKPKISSIKPTAPPSEISGKTWICERKRMQNKLNLVIFIGFPVFPIAYLLRYYNIIDRDVLCAIYMIGGFFLKCGYVTVLSMESVVLQASAVTRMNVSRQQFLRYVFHDIRVPLNTLTMGLVAIKDNIIKLNETDKEIIMLMSNAVGYMSDTLNDVSSMTQIEAGAVKLNFQPFIVNELINYAILAVTTQAKNKNVEIIIKCQVDTGDDVDTPFVSQFNDSVQLIGDRLRLGHALVNILSNAIKFSPSGEIITVEISICLPNGIERKTSRTTASPKKISTLFNSRFFHESGKNASQILSKSLKFSSSLRNVINNSNHTKRLINVRVIDSGMGISLEAKERLKSPFGGMFSLTDEFVAHNNAYEYRQKQITSERVVAVNGCDLGLLLSKQIVEFHGGNMVVESDIGKGCTIGFSILLEVVAEVKKSQSSRSHNHSVLNSIHFLRGSSKSIFFNKNNTNFSNKNLSSRSISKRLMTSFKLKNQHSFLSNNGSMKSLTMPMPNIQKNRFCSRFEHSYDTDNVSPPEKNHQDEIFYNERMDDRLNIRFPAHVVAEGDGSLRASSRVDDDLTTLNNNYLQYNDNNDEDNSLNQNEYHYDEDISKHSVVENTSNNVVEENSQTMVLTPRLLTNRKSLLHSLNTIFSAENGMSSSNSNSFSIRGFQNSDNMASISIDHHDLNRLAPQYNIEINASHDIDKYNSDECDDNCNYENSQFRRNRGSNDLLNTSCVGVGGGSSRSSSQQPSRRASFLSKNAAFWIGGDGVDTTNEFTSKQIKMLEQAQVDDDVDFYAPMSARDAENNGKCIPNRLRTFMIVDGKFIHYFRIIYMQFRDINLY